MKFLVINNMIGLELTLKTSLKHSLDCSRLTPNLLIGLSLANIKALNFYQHQKVSDFFDVSGKTISENNTHIVFKQSNSFLDNIGNQMREGTITIEGDCGNFLGAKMQGGTIICKGNTGDRVADNMRRGMVLIEGNVANYCASSMIAGTVGILGNAGKYLGYGAKRGTLLLANQPADQATWVDCGLLSFPFLELLFKSFKQFDTQFSKLNTTRAQRWAGDIAGIGKAEILLLKSD